MTEMEWYGADDPRCYYKGRESIDYYESELQARRRRYPGALADKHPDVAAELEEKGCCVLRQVFDAGRLARLREEAEAALADVRLLKKNDANMKMVSNPLLNLPSAVDITFDDLLADIATSYFRCVPGVGTVNMRQSFVNDLPPVETMLWHSDKNAFRFLKFFFYLNDVDVDGGPFTYMEGSHKRKFAGWLDKYRWSHDEIVERYGEQRLRYLTARVGDVVIANTTGFHRGTKPAKHDRLMYTVDYGIHVELGAGDQRLLKQGAADKRFLIKEEDYRRLPQSKKPLADFLIKVPADQVEASNHTLKERARQLTWV